MNISRFIARRYLFSRKSHHAINIISGISMGGVALATIALVCTLSVMNGFRDLIGGLYTSFDPVLRVVPAKGKFIAANDSVLLAILEDKSVAAATRCLEDNALIIFEGRPAVITLKGVDENFRRTSDIDSILIGEGSYCLQAAGVNYGIPGALLAESLGGIEYGSIVLAAPKKGERVNTVNPGANFNAEKIFSTGVAFQVNQSRYDEHVLLTSLSLAEELFEQEGRITALELALKEGIDAEAAEKHLQAIAGERLDIQNRMEQQAETFGLMNIEKMITYLLLTFIALVACFNVIGAVSMLIIDKKNDVQTLRALGMQEKEITRVFMTEGRLITLIGATAGIIMGLGICLMQQHFGLLRLSGGSDNFIVEAYPVSVYPADILLTFLTVVFVGFLTVWYPVNYICKRLLNNW